MVEFVGNSEVSLEFRGPCLAAMLGTELFPGDLFWLATMLGTELFPGDLFCLSTMLSCGIVSGSLTMTYFVFRRCLVAELFPGADDDLFCGAIMLCLVEMKLELIFKN